MVGRVVAFLGEGGGDADVGVVWQGFRIQGVAFAVFVADGDFPAVAARGVRRRAVEIVAGQPQGLFARVSDADAAVVFAFFHRAEGGVFAVNPDGGVLRQLAGKSGEPRQPGEFLGAEVVVGGEEGAQVFAFFVVHFPDEAQGVARVVRHALPRALQLFEAGEVVRGDAGAAAVVVVAVVVAVFVGGGAGKAFARCPVFAEQREGGGDVKAIGAVKPCARLTVVAQDEPAHAFTGVGEGVVGVAVGVGVFAVVVAVAVVAQVGQCPRQGFGVFQLFVVPHLREGFASVGGEPAVFSAVPP